MIHTCFPAAPGAMLHQLDKEAGQVVGVQHSCQGTQGQTGDKTEREKQHLQINARICTMQMLPEATGRGRKETMICIPRSTVEQGELLLCLLPRAQCHCHCGHSQLLKGVQAPPVTPQESHLESWAHPLLLLGTYLSTWSVMNRSTDRAFREISNSITSACFCSSCGGTGSALGFQAPFPKSTERQAADCIGNHSLGRKTGH